MAETEERKAYRRDWYIKNFERIRALRRQNYLRNKERVLKQSRKYYEEHREKRITQTLEWRTKNQQLFKEINDRSKKKYLANPENRIKILARNALRMAVRRGVIQKPSACSKCGGRGIIDGHHHKGYAKEHRFDVVWLCRSCHPQVH